MRHLPDSRALLEMHRCRQQNQAVGGPSWMYIREDIDVGDNDSLIISWFVDEKKERIPCSGVFRTEREREKSSRTFFPILHES